MTLFYKKSSKVSGIFLSALIATLFLCPRASYATITDGANAIDAIGQYSPFPDVIYTTSDEQNGEVSVNAYGLRLPRGLAVDTVNHRLFLADSGNRRVLVFNLNTSDELVDKTPDYVLGQSDFTSSTSAFTQAGMSFPSSIVYDSTNNRLFVTDGNGNRVTVYDVASIVNGEGASSVLGQPDFTTVTGGATTQNEFSSPSGLAYNGSDDWLFVADSLNNRVLVFDTTSIDNGENAMNVLGQTDFVSAASVTTQNGLFIPIGLAYDDANKRLFVGETGSYRVSVFDVNSVVDGEDAISVLGAPDFTTAAPTSGQDGLTYPRGLSYDSAGDRLFVADSSNSRVTVFDVASITDGENAVNVLGQPDFATLVGVTTQDGMSGTYGAAYNSTNGRLYVADFNNNRITIFDASTTADTTAPTITNVSSDKTNGTYTIGEVIDIDVTFSEAVTSTGNVTVTLETGATDRTCTFTVTGSTTGTCNYTVQSGDTSSDLTVGSISGTIADAASNAMTNFVPATNLAVNKALVIDTTAPSAPSPSPAGATYSSAQSVLLTSAGNTIYYTVDGTTPTTGSTLYSSAIAISGTTTLKAISVDIAGNSSSVMSEIYTITSGSTDPDVGDDEDHGAGGGSEEATPSPVPPKKKRITRLTFHPQPSSRPVPVVAIGDVVSPIRATDVPVAEKSPDVPDLAQVSEQGGDMETTKTLLDESRGPDVSSVVSKPIASKAKTALSPILLIMKKVGSVSSVVIAGVTAVAMAPVIALHVAPHIGEFIRFIGTLFTLQRKKARLGVLVDSTIGAPIAGAVIQVFDTKFQQLKETQVTGKDGQFGFLLPPGSYTLVASASGFTFPSHKKLPIPLKNKEQLYDGKEFVVQGDDAHAIPHLVMMMDRTADATEKFLSLRRFSEQVFAYVDRIGASFLLLGALFSALLLVDESTPLNIIFAGVYLILLSLKLYLLRTHQHAIGTVLDADTAPVDSAIVRLYAADTNRIIQTRVTNVHGRFFILVPKGVYTAVISKAGYATRTLSNLRVFGNASKALAINAVMEAEIDNKEIYSI